MHDYFRRMWLSKGRRRHVGRKPGESGEVLESRVLLSANAIQVADTNGGVGTVRSFQFNSGTTSFSGVVNSTNATIQNLLGVKQEYVGLGDFNGDGFQDLVVKTPGGLIGAGGMPAPVGQLFVLLNNGSNSFTASIWDSNVPVTPGSGSNSWTDFQIGDFSGDGKADLLARVSATGEWYLWTSTGTGFTKSLFGTWIVGVQWQDAVIGDFDNDGKMDLAGRQIATDSSPPGTVDQWYIGLGSRGVAATLGTVGAVGNQWWNITNTDSKLTIANTVVGDFDGDGKDDLAIRTLSATATNGSRDSEWRVVKPGLVDVTVSFPASAWTSWTHQTATGIQNQWTDVQSADLNGDGKSDLIGRTGSGEWWGTLGSTTLPAGTSATLVANWSSSAYKNSTTLVADFNGDNKAELVVRDVSNDRWLIAQFGTTTFSAPTAAGGAASLGTWSPNPSLSFAGGAPNGGQTYVNYQRKTIGVRGTSDPLAVLEYDATLNLGSSAGTSSYGGDPSYTMGRFNANGNFDYQYYGGAVASSTLPTMSALGRTFTADFNGDGLPDILTQFSPSTSWYLSLNQGNAFGSPQATSIPTSFTGTNAQLRVSDFTGDGKADLLVMSETSATTGRWDLYVSTGTGFASGVNIANPTTSAGVNFFGGAITGGEVADFDGDGKSDITITRARPGFPGTYDTYVAYSNGTSGWDFYQKWSRTPGSGVTFVDPSLFTRFGDFNGDGKLDLAGLQNLTTYVFSNMQLIQVVVGQLVVAPGNSTRSSSLSTSTTTNLSAPFVLSSGSGPILFETGRFVGANGVPDLLDDIIVGEDSSGSPTWTVAYVWRSQGTIGGTPAFGTTPAFSGNVPYGSGTTYSRSKIADVDHDGNDDLVWQQIGSAGPISLMVNSNIATLSSSSSFGVPVITGPKGAVTVSTTIGRLRRRG